MNYVCLSPNFPPNYVNFSKRLHERGVTVLGIGSDPYDHLAPVLKDALTEYYRVDDMEHYDSVLRACAYFTFKYGKLDRIESHNEHWLAQDARLRTDFNVFGFKSDDLSDIRLKSRMKEVFRRIGVPVAYGRVVTTWEEARALIKDTGYPVCAKPDSGVGAAHTYKLKNEEDLQRFFDTKPPVDYIMEEFIEGEIHTFDGLTDQEGRVVFMNTFIFDKGVMETVNDDLDMFYYSLRKIPEDLKNFGLRSVEAFGLKERFFHIEFFRTAAGKVIALEINMRPPGGWSMDLFNYANEADLYDEYARLVTENQFNAPLERPYYVAYTGLKLREHVHHIQHQEDILAGYGDLIIQHGPIESVFAAAIGDYAYVLRSPELETLKEAAAFILQRA
ncbi:MAG: ATP-grasp domain-containing protein [Bacillota bacterium]|nr:ATP-grasp domain-containing protein [Bacillota bacterium]